MGARENAYLYAAQHLVLYIGHVSYACPGSKLHRSGLLNVFASCLTQFEVCDSCSQQLHARYLT